MKNILKCLLCSLLLLGVASDVKSQQVDFVVSEGKVIRIAKVGNKLLNGRNKVQIDEEHQLGGIDIELEAWNLENDHKIWLLSKSTDETRWEAYGPAKKSEIANSWKIYGLQLEKKLYKGKHFVIRAVSSADSLFGEREFQSWVQLADVLSDPVRISIDKRSLPRGETKPAIWIRTINHETVDPLEPMIVPASATMAGTVDPETRGSMDSAEVYIHVVVHPIQTDEWYISDFTKAENFQWQLVDVMFKKPDEPLWTDFEVFAVMTNQKLPKGLTNYPIWKERSLTTSPVVKLFVKNEPMIMDPLRIPSIQINKYKPINGRYKDLDSEKATIRENKDQIIELGGEVEGVKPGSYLYVLINPVGSSVWMVLDGKMILKDDVNWQFSNFKFEPPGVFQSAYYKCLVIVSSNELRKGVCSYDYWRSHTIAISPIVIIEDELSAPKEQKRNCY